jgi:hypothetical protein
MKSGAVPQAESNFKLSETVDTFNNDVLYA